MTLDNPNTTGKRAANKSRSERTKQGKQSPKRTERALKSEIRSDKAPWSRGTREEKNQMRICKDLVGGRGDISRFATLQVACGRKGEWFPSFLNVGEMKKTSPLERGVVSNKSQPV